MDLYIYIYSPDYSTTITGYDGFSIFKAFRSLLGRPCIPIECLLRS